MTELRRRVFIESLWRDWRDCFWVDMDSRAFVGVGDRGLEDIDVPGRDMDGGSEARESRIPAILKRSLPRRLRRAKTVGRSEEV